MLLARLRRRLLLTAFRLLYNEMAWTYDAVAWAVSTGLWWTWQQTAIAHLTGRKVLEIAVGTGRLLPVLGQGGFDAVGIDRSPYMVRITRRRVRSGPLPVVLCQASADALPFVSASFDSVVTTFPTAFLSEESVLNEIERVLKPGGRLVVVQHASVLRPAIVARVIEWLYGATDQPTDGAESPSAWLRQAGWSVRDVRTPSRRSVVYLAVASPSGRHSDSQ